VAYVVATAFDDEKPPLKSSSNDSHLTAKPTILSGTPWYQTNAGELIVERARLSKALRREVLLEDSGIRRIRLACMSSVYACATG
jgi:hypothetical protein